ncbi:MAG TPA: PKD domain-containing protein, partial [Bacteroidetes bacterium]|nr:PKD domain-containing protein [Bacteroidota bacterium]
MNLRPAICFKWHIPACLLFFLSFFIIQKNNAQPAGFTDQLFLSGWNEVAGFTWDANGRMYVWERDGRVWIVENGARLPNPLLDISDEVGGWRDFGLLGFALDPNFLSNGYFYLLYVVDRHHLFNAGTSQYDPNTNEYFAATIGRITRYQADGTTNYSTIVPGSRLVLVGANEQDGPPILHESHGTGSLVFGDDGTLLATLGDGASYSSLDQGSASETYWQQGLDDGIITPAQNIGAYRCQTLDNYSGKILRIDPATGQGLPSNPFWDAANPQSPASRTWARGVRNPYRMCLVPESGSHVPSDGNPGTFIFGDVGWGTREELNVVNAPGLNFGWPKFEGMTHQPGYNNPDYTPAQHELPKVDWRTGTPRGLVNGSIVNVGSAALPGPVFNGNASTGGVWYGHGDFPEEWHDTYFHADYGAGWIRNFRFDNNWNPVEVKNFINTAGACVFLNTDPAQTALYYVRWPDQIRKVSFTGTTLHTPVAFASANVISGTSPLTVSFSSFNTFDQDGDPLTYLWDFGDGTTSTLPHPVHTFSGGPGPTGFTVSLTVSDPGGLSDEATLPISLNNLPPAILSTSVDAIHTFDPNTTTVVSLSANVSDGDHPASQLSYFWDVKLFHNNHSHPLQSFTTPTASVNLTAVNCYSASYWYQVNLTVSDPAGATSFYQKNIYPACAGTAQNISFTPIPDKVAGDVPFAISASATSGLPVTFYVVEGPAGVLGNIVTLQGVPGKVTIVATQPGDGVYAPATNVEQSFWVNANSTGSQNQAITFPAIPDKLTTDAPFTISASATSGLPVSFQVVSGPATISGNTVTLTGQPGAVTIRATQTGNTQWSAALPVERTFQVSLPSGGGNVDLELTVESDHSVLTLFNTISFTFTLTNTGTATADNVRVFLPIPSTVVWVGGNEYSLSQGTYDHLGSKVWFLGDLPAAANATITVNWYVLASDPLTAWAEVSATDQTDADSTPGNGTCCTANEDDEASMTLTMPGQGPQNQTISFAPISDKETTDAPFIIAASATSGLPVSFQIVSGPATIAGNIVTLNGTTGTVTVRATQSGNANWNPAPPVEQSFLVNEPGLLNQTITFAPLPNKQTTDAPFTISAIATSGLPVGFSIVGGP